VAAGIPVAHTHHAGVRPIDAGHRPAVLPRDPPEGRGVAVIERSGERNARRLRVPRAHRRDRGAGGGCVPREAREEDLREPLTDERDLDVRLGDAQLKDDGRCPFEHLLPRGVHRREEFVKRGGARVHLLAAVAHSTNVSSAASIRIPASRSFTRMSMSSPTSNASSKPSTRRR